MFTRISIPILFVTGFLFSCSNVNRPNDSDASTVQFSFQKKVLAKKMASKIITDAKKIFISIEKSDGTPVITDSSIDLIDFNGYLITEPIGLKVGEYKLIKFLVLDSYNDVIYATPLSGSELATAVENPLPIEFSIIKDEVNMVVPEVISVKGETPNKFGYASFSLIEVEVFNFQIAAFIFDSKIQNWKLTGANLKIKGDGDLIYDYPFTDTTSIISLKDGYDNYELTVSKYGYENLIKTYTKAELMAHLNDPIIIHFNVITFTNTFIKTFGGTDADMGSCIQLTNDGGYIIAGRTYSFGAGLGDIYLLKISESGTEQWSKTFGGTSEDRCEYIQQTGDDGYILIGGNYSTSYNISLIKVDSNGSMTWSKTFGDNETDESGHCVQQTSDNGYIAVGTKSSDIYMIKTSSDGTEIWSRRFGTTSNSEAGSYIQQTSDGGYIIVGSIYYFDTYQDDVYVIKTTENGEVEWSETFGGAGRDFGTFAEQTTDGGYIITGVTMSFGVGTVYLLKISSAGSLIWQTSFGNNNLDRGDCVQQTSDGGFIIAGSSYSPTTGSDAYLIKTTNNGTKVWSRNFCGDNYDNASFVRQTSDGGYVITGTTRSMGAGDYDVYLIKTDKNGNVK